MFRALSKIVGVLAACGGASLCFGQPVKLNMQPPLPSVKSVVVYTTVTEDGKAMSGLGSSNFKVTISGKDSQPIAVPTFDTHGTPDLGIVFVFDTSSFKSPADPQWSSLVRVATNILRNPKVGSSAIVTTSGVNFPFASPTKTSDEISSLKPAPGAGSLAQAIKDASNWRQQMPSTLHPVIMVMVGKHSSAAVPAAGDVSIPVFVIDASGSTDVALEALATATKAAYVPASHFSEPTDDLDNFVQNSLTKSVAQLYGVIIPASDPHNPPAFTLSVLDDQGKVLASADYKGKGIEPIYLIAAAVVTLILLAALFIAVRKVMSSKAEEEDRQYQPYEDEDRDGVTHGMDRPVFGHNPDSTSGTVSGTFGVFRPGGSTAGDGDSTLGEWASAGGQVGDVTEGEDLSISRACVEVLSGPSQGKSMDVRTGLVIGREAGAGQTLVIVGDPKVSRRHAEIRPDVASGGKTQFRLVHLSQTNQTYLNDRPVRDEALRNGDEVRVGSTRMKFHEGAGVAPSAQPTGFAAGDVTSGDVTL